MIKKIIFTFLHLYIFTLLASAQTWKVYPSYDQHTKAVKVGSRIYCLASESIFCYDTEDESVENYDKINGLSDFGVGDIAGCSGLKTLVIYYSNSNIDLLKEDGTAYNMPELKEKILSDKTFNELRTFGSLATVCVNSGLLILDVKREVVQNYYDIGQKVQSCVINDGNIYLKTGGGYFYGNKNKNLLDKNNWIQLSATTTPTESSAKTLFNEQSKTEKTSVQENLELVKNINIDGPKQNWFYRMRYYDDKLVVAGGCFNYPELKRTGTIMTLQNGKWDAFDEESASQRLKNPALYRNITDVVQDPADTAHYYASAACVGLFEFRNGHCDTLYTYTNSPLTSILPNDANAEYYVRITGLSFDVDENLWMLNNECDTIIRIMKKDGKWMSYYLDEINGYPTFDQVVFDDNGWAWINSRRTTSAGHHAGVVVINTNGTIDNKSDDKHVFISTLKNEDGKSYTDKFAQLNCIVKDLNGWMWIGTNQGVFYVEDPTRVFDSDFYYIQPRVPRDDGSSYADYLLNEVAIKCIAVDGGNRKWFGTENNGVYLTNAEGTEVIAHYTEDNSPLISDEIYTIAINGETGEVMIGTGAGLCSLYGNVTDPVSEMDEDKILVYPNPVRPDYNGTITITGLMSDTYVSIVSANGRLVNKGISTGGSYVWDGKLNNGRKVQSGIYYILATDSEGNEKAAAKFMIVR